LRLFYGKKISDKIDASFLGKEWVGKFLKITGGQDKQGFPMKQGVLTTYRVKLLLSKGNIGCRGFSMKKGSKIRKSVRGCIVSPEISVLNLLILQKLNFKKRKDEENPVSIYKRVSKIRKILHITKQDDVRKHIIRSVSQPNNKSYPKIQRMITPLSLQKKRFLISLRKKQMIITKNKIEEFGKVVYHNK